MKISEVKKCDAADAVDADTIETPYIISDDSPPRRIPTTLSFSVFFIYIFLSLFLSLFPPLSFSTVVFPFAKVVGGLYAPFRYPICRYLCAVACVHR